MTVTSHNRHNYTLIEYTCMVQIYVERLQMWSDWVHMHGSDICGAITHVDQWILKIKKF